MPASKKKDATRGRRYEKVADLRTAVRSACTAHVSKRGGSWTEADQSRLDEIAAFIRRAPDNIAEAQRWLTEAKEAFRATEEHTVIALGNAAALAAEVEKFRPLSLLQALVRTYSVCRDWWWQGWPTNRDLAVLCLLAGHFPDSERHPQQMTAADVIRMEERAVREAMRGIVRADEPAGPALLPFNMARR
jgi:hypothetical protein